MAVVPATDLRHVIVLCRQVLCHLRTKRREFFPHLAAAVSGLTGQLADAALRLTYTDPRLDGDVRRELGGLIPLMIVSGAFALGDDEPQWAKVIEMTLQQGNWYTCERRALLLGLDDATRRQRHAELEEITLTLLAQLLRFFPGIGYGREQTDAILKMQLQPTLAAALADDKPLKVRHIAVVATNTVVAGQDSDLLLPLDTFVPSMLEVLMALSEAAEYQLLATAIKSFHQVAIQLSPELLSRYLDTMLRFTAATTLPNSVRSLAFETLTNLAEEAPHKLRKMTDFIHNAFSIAIHLYLEVNEESTIWSYDEEKEMEGDLTDEEGEEEEEEDDAEEAAPDFMEGMDDDDNEEEEVDEENEDEDENEASESRPPKRARVGGSEHLQRGGGGDSNDNDAESTGSRDPQERVRKEWEDGPEAVAESGLSSLALAFGSKITVPICMKWVEQFIRCEDWKYRYAALMCLFAIIEGCEREFSRDPSYVTHLVVGRMRDPHPRVRYAACGCIAQLSLNLKRGAPFQVQYHGLIIPALMSATQDISPHVQERSCQALVNVFEEEMSEMLAPFSEPERERIIRLWEELLENLLDLTRNENKKIKQAAIIAVAATADSLKERFAKYYERFAPICLDILRRERPAVTRRDKKLAARALECITQMALSVGPAPCNKYAKEVVEILRSSTPFAQQLRTESSTFVSAAIGRIALCMKLDFLPYLADFFSHLERATVAGNELIMDPPSMDSMLGAWDFHRRNERVLEDKLLAIKTLFTITSEYSETVDGALGYFPYAARTFQVLQEVIHTSYDQECHIFAPTCFPPLVTIYRKVIEWRIQNGQTEAQNRKRKSTEDTAEARTDHDGLRPPHEPLPATVSSMTERSLDSLMASIWNMLLNLLSRYSEADVIDETLQSLSACLNAAGDVCLDLALITRTTECIFHVTRESEGRLLALRDAIGSEDEEALVASQEKEHQINNSAEWLYSDMTKHHWPLFDEALTWRVLHEGIALVNNSDFKRGQTTGVCIVADCIDLLPGVKTFIRTCLRTCATFIEERNSRLLQAAVYAIGACAEKDGQNLADTLTKEVLPRIVQRVEKEYGLGNGRDAALDEALDNAIASAVKICYYCHQSLSDEELFGTAEKFMSWLPLRSDVIEMVTVSSVLCQFLESSEERLRKAVLGPNSERRDKIVGMLEAHMKSEAELGRTRLRSEVQEIDKSHDRLQATLAKLKT